MTRSLFNLVAVLAHHEVLVKVAELQAQYTRHDWLLQAYITHETTTFH